MRRREFITLVGGAAAWPLAARAQQSRRAVGILGVGSFDALGDANRDGLRKGLSELGFMEGKDYVFLERRSGEQNDRLAALASELAHLPVNVIVATGSAGVARAAIAATKTIPIVFANGSDPVKLGLVSSMNRPGFNATGITFLVAELGPKRLELLRELVPGARKIAVLVNPTNPATEPAIRDIENAARKITQPIFLVRASTRNEINAAFELLRKEKAQALIVNVDAFFSARRSQIAELAQRHTIPTIYNNRDYVDAGGLISYGDRRSESYRLVGVYVGRILKGDRPSDLPVLQPTKFELVVNLKAAKSIGLTIPEAFLLRADEVIE